MYNTGQDRIKIEVLQDGTIRLETDQVSGPNHASAEEFLRIMAELAGGGQTRVRKAGAHHHHRGHSHTHEHADHTH